MTRHVVARRDEIAPGERKLVTLMGREVGIFNVAGEFYALANRCPHEGAPLCKGLVTGFNRSDEPGRYWLERKGEVLRCPWHAWEFDIKTGQSWCDPKNIRARSYAVAVEPGEELVKGPYVAETFAVAVEEDYLVIEA
jgi:3-phenylpropionate/trans-cinnamate dioxygenase ferredoxin subunit